jgi:hypothetical protein
MYIRAEQIDPAHEGTLSWMYASGPQGPGFESWLREGKEVFWVQGKAGSGKSTAMKNLFVNGETSRILKRGPRKTWDVIGLFFTDRGGPGTTFVGRHVACHAA